MFLEEHKKASIRPRPTKRGAPPIHSAILPDAAGCFNSATTDKSGTTPRRWRPSAYSAGLQFAHARQVVEHPPDGAGVPESEKASIRPRPTSRGAQRGPL